MSQAVQGSRNSFPGPIFWSSMTTPRYARDSSTSSASKVGVPSEHRTGPRRSSFWARAPWPGMILLDLNMPVMDGWDFVRALERMPALPQNSHRHHVRSRFGARRPAPRDRRRLLQEAPEPRCASHGRGPASASPRDLSSVVRCRVPGIRIAVGVSGGSHGNYSRFFDFPGCRAKGREGRAEDRRRVEERLRSRGEPGPGCRQGSGEKVRGAAEDAAASGRDIAQDYLKRGRRRLSHATERVSAYADANTAVVAAGAFAAGLLVGHFARRR